MRFFTRVVLTSLVLGGFISQASAQKTKTEAGPAQATVRANSQFGLELYQLLAASKEGENVFFSPYSISNCLMMAAEGARGTTALEFGKVLHFPASARRTGADGVMQPWDTSPLHAGFAQLNRGLYRPASPDEEAVKKELEDLQKQMAELQKQGRDFIRMQALSKQMAELDAKLASYELNVANSLWVEKSFPLMQPFKDALAVHHDTGGAYPVDFLQKAEQERQAINQWVEQQTKNYIKDLFPQGSITSDTRVVLANAIYFKGAWQEPFPVAATQQKDFHLTDGKTVKAPLMQHEKSKARYGAFTGNGQPFATPRFYDDNLKPTDYYPAADGFTAVELPYKGGQLSLLVIAPQKPEGLAALEKKLTADNLNDWLSKLGNRKVVVDLPKYKVESSFSLNGSLAKLGLGEAFAPGKANFQGISNAENLYISAAVHKAYVEVSEEGTVAAAATGLSISTTSAPVQIPFVPHFRADRPFLFMIRDGSTGLVLFMGRVMNPAE